MLSVLGCIYGIPMAQAHGWLSHSEVRQAWLYGPWSFIIFTAAYVYFGKAFVQINVT